MTDEVSDLTEPTTWYVDERLESVERHLQQLGVSDEAIEMFVEFWNAGDDNEKARLYALGDVRMLDEVRGQSGRDIFAPPATDEELGVPTVDPHEVSPRARTATGTGRPATAIEVPVGVTGELVGDGEGQALPPADDDDEEALAIVEESVERVVEWVGDDPERAGRALRAEMLMEEPRKTLTTRLAKLAD